MKKEEFWWNPSRILSYNCLFNFVIGNRGGGKTFGVKEHMIRKSLENDVTFMYLRRTDVELKDAKKTFFDDIVHENKFPGRCFREYAGSFQTCVADEYGEPAEDEKWETIGYNACLSGARTKKSVSYSTVKFICFDEFIIPDLSINRYLPDEVTAFLEFYETVARMRDVTVLFLANALTTINPYFLYFDLRIPYNTSICRIKKDVAFELVDNPDYKEAKKATRFGQLISGTDYEKYAIDNEFVWEEDNDIAKLDDTFEYFSNLSWNKEIYAIYRSNEKQQMIISGKVDKTRKWCIELELKNGKINKMMMTERAKYYYLNTLVELFLRGFVYYDSKKVKAAVQPMFAKLI